MLTAPNNSLASKVLFSAMRQELSVSQAPASPGTLLPTPGRGLRPWVSILCW